MILGRRDFPAESLNAFVHYVQANSHKLDEGHEGVGSIPFVACLLLNHLLLAKPRLVPYEGTASLMDAVARGRIDYVCESIVNAAPQVRAGRVKAFGVAATERSAALPDVPTTKEGGLPTYEVSVWYAIFAPKGVPKAVVEKINGALSKVLEDETVRRRMRDLGADIPDPGQRTPEALAELVRDEMNRWASLIKAERVNPN